MAPTCGSLDHTTRGDPAPPPIAVTSSSAGGSSVARDNTARRTAGRSHSRTRPSRSPSHSPSHRRTTTRFGRGQCPGRPLARSTLRRSASPRPASTAMTLRTARLLPQLVRTSIYAYGSLSLIGIRRYALRRNAERAAGRCYRRRWKQASAEMDIIHSSSLTTSSSVPGGARSAFRRVAAELGHAERRAALDLDHVR